MNRFLLSKAKFLSLGILSTLFVFFLGANVVAVLGFGGKKDVVSAVVDLPAAVNITRNESKAVNVPGAVSVTGNGQKDTHSVGVPQEPFSVIFRIVTELGVFATLLLLFGKAIVNILDKIIDRMTYQIDQINKQSIELQAITKENTEKINSLIAMLSKIYESNQRVLDLLEKIIQQASYKKRIF